MAGDHFLANSAQMIKYSLSQKMAISESQVLIFQTILKTTSLLSRSSGPVRYIQSFTGTLIRNSIMLSDL